MLAGMRLLALAAAALLAAASASAPAFAASKTAYTQRRENALRRGPGAYYPVVFVLGRGAPVEVLKSAGGWSQVELRGMKTPAIWLADNALGPAPPKGFLEGLFKPAPPARMAAASAAVRGFALRFGRGKAPEVDGLLKRPEPFSPAEYAAFRAASPARRSLLSGELAPYDPSPEEEGVGLGVASQVAARGSAAKPGEERYLNLLAASLAEASGAYERSFRVSVMKGEEVNALSAPGGWIFVTRPLLKACRSEAELAAVLAHEMTHIIRRHGLKELKARDTLVKADAAQAELDAMAGPGPDDTEEADLDDIAAEAYDGIHKPRLQSYEEEADRGAAVLLARAGYDPAAVPRMIERVGAAVAASQKRGDENPFAAMDYTKRKQAVELFLRAGLRGVSGASNEQRLARELRL
jgi:hypothetical protein